MNSEDKVKIREAREAIEKAQAKVERLCDGKEHWRMSVPARPNDDHDLVISDALFKADEALALLDAEDKPSVPMAMLIKCRDTWPPDGVSRKEALREICKAYGYEATE